MEGFVWPDSDPGPGPFLVSFAPGSGSGSSYGSGGSGAMRAPAALLVLAVVARPSAAQPCAAPDQTRGFRPGPCDCLCESGSHIDVTRALGDGTCGSLGGAWDFARHGLDGHGSCEAHRSELESHLQSGLGMPLAQVQQACCVPRPAADDPLDADSWCAAVPRGSCDVEALVGELRTLMTEDNNEAPTKFLLERLDRTTFCRCRSMTKLMGRREPSAAPEVKGECLGTETFQCPQAAPAQRCSGDLIDAITLTGTGSAGGMQAGCEQWCRATAGVATTTCCGLRADTQECSLHVGRHTAPGDAEDAACLPPAPRLGADAGATDNTFSAGLQPLATCFEGSVLADWDAPPTHEQLAHECPVEYALCRATDNCIEELNRERSRAETPSGNDQDAPPPPLAASLAEDTAALLRFKESGDPSLWPAEPSCTGTSYSWDGRACDLDATTDSTADCPNGCTHLEPPQGVFDALGWPTAPACSGTANGRYDVVSQSYITPVCDLNAATDGTGECPEGCDAIDVPAGWTAADSASVCDWAGVECSGSRVTGLDFGGKTWLTGDISLLADLPLLDFVDVDDSFVFGSAEALAVTRRLAEDAAALLAFKSSGSAASGWQQIPDKVHCFALDDNRILRYATQQEAESACAASSTCQTAFGFSCEQSQHWALWPPQDAWPPSGSCTGTGGGTWDQSGNVFTAMT